MRISSGGLSVGDVDTVEYVDAQRTRRGNPWRRVISLEESCRALILAVIELMIGSEEPCNPVVYFLENGLLLDPVQILPESN